MAHGKTLEMKAIKRPETQWVHQHAPAEGVFSSPLPAIPYRNSEKDRTLRGKARIRARRAANSPATHADTASEAVTGR